MTEKHKSKRRHWIIGSLIVITILTVVVLGGIIYLDNSGVGEVYVYSLFGGNATSAEMQSSANYASVIAAMPMSGEPVYALDALTGRQQITIPVEAEESVAFIGDIDSSDDMFFEDYGVNPFTDAAQDNLSTFAMDVDTASYTLARSYLLDYNELPPAEAIRPEEFINYFPTDYAQPQSDNAFAIHMDAAAAPYGEDGQLLLRVGLQGRSVASADRDPALLVFVIDISGSMEQTNRIHLAKEALNILVGQLREDDRVAIVVYADNTRVVLEPTPASEQNQIISAINGLATEGSTYAEAGLRLAYNVALANMREGENARVILISDGVANVGETGPDAILNTVREGVESGITLSAIGFGMGNFNDVLMEQLANDGNGNYFYVDNVREARRVFVHNLTSTLQVIAYDAKIQVEFNPDAVLSYRLIGYENRNIADEDFRDDTVDAGEVGAGHTVTALYEVEINPQAQSSATLATAFIRYEDAESREVVEVNQPFAIADAYASFEDAPDSFHLLAAVTEFSEILRGSPFAEDRNYQSVLSILEALSANNPDIGELMQMITSAEMYQQ
jgi:Ca-activated chloride channel family protein